MITSSVASSFITSFSPSPPSRVVLTLNSCPNFFSSSLSPYHLWLIQKDLLSSLTCPCLQKTNAQMLFSCGQGSVTSTEINAPTDMIDGCFLIRKGTGLSAGNGPLPAGSVSPEPWSAGFLMLEHRPDHTLEIVSVKSPSAFPHLRSHSE